MSAISRKKFLQKSVSNPKGVERYRVFLRHLCLTMAIISPLYSNRMRVLGFFPMKAILSCTWHMKWTKNKFQSGHKAKGNHEPPFRSFRFRPETASWLKKIKAKIMANALFHFVQALNETNGPIVFNKGTSQVDIQRRFFRPWIVGSRAGTPKDF